MSASKKISKIPLLLILLFFICNFSTATGNKDGAEFKVIAFYTGKNDRAHDSYVHEANRWFAEMAGKHNFRYDSTNNWDNMNDDFLSRYQVVIFLDTRPDSAYQREAFRKYMEEGGSWIGFHFSAFALTPSAYPQDWDWYHKHFLGAGQYAGNTWAPTSAILRTEDRQHPAARHLPAKFTASPNEWYKWEYDLRDNPDIKILLSVDPVSFPLGTGPKPHEIWHSGYYPVVWCNTDYKMIYINMGHNIIDYENKTNRELSQTFNNKNQNKLIIDALFWLGKGLTIKKICHDKISEPDLFCGNGSYELSRKCSSDE